MAEDVFVLSKLLETLSWERQIINVAFTNGHCLVRAVKTVENYIIPIICWINGMAAML